MQTYLSLGALLISIVSLLVSFAANKRTKKTQEYDYGVRLQIENEKCEFGSPSLPHFRYWASIRNKGLKPVEIAWIWMQYGESSANSTTRRFKLESGFTLSPGEERSVHFARDKAAMSEMLKEVGGSECVFSLLVEFRSFEGEPKMVTRRLGGYKWFNEEVGLLFAAQHEMLT